MKRRAFTLIELLVVISIIALLISILLPSLSGARRTGQRVACLADLRTIGQGVSIYGQDNEDWFPGTPGGSGAYLFGAPFAWGPAVQRFDFIGPLAHLWGNGWIEPSLGDPQGWAERVKTITSEKPSLCPSNNFLAPWNMGPNIGAIRMNSYNTTRYMMWQRQPFDPANPGEDLWVSWYNGSHEE